jgi:hypothetical protein
MVYVSTHSPLSKLIISLLNLKLFFPVIYDYDELNALRFWSKFPSLSKIKHPGIKFYDLSGGAYLFSVA